MAVFVANTNLIELTGLKDAVTDAYINDAVVTATIRDNDDNLIGGGASWPLTLAYVAASNGNYRAILDSTLLLLADTDHYAYLNVNAGPGRAGHWSFKFKPTTRT